MTRFRLVAPLLIPTVVFIGACREEPAAQRAVAEQHRPSCNDSDSYGKTIQGRWLADLLVDIGAPGNHPVSHKQILDTGTALSIDIRAYEKRLTLYATFSRPFPVNEDWEPPEERIGRQDGIEFFLTNGDFVWESYKARTDEWQLALIGYPVAAGDEVTWPTGTLEWLARAAKIAQDASAQCAVP